METKDVIRELRKKHGYTAEQVAEGAGISRSVYPKYESGILNAGVPVLCKLADFYNVTTDYLLGREQATKPDMLTLLAREFNLSELDKALVQAYIAISPTERGKFIKSIEDAVKQKESTRQSTGFSAAKSQPDVKISQKAIARSKTEEYPDVPTAEQIANFIPVPEDSDL